MMFTGGDFQGGRIHSQGFLDQAEDPGIGHFLEMHTFFFLDAPIAHIGSEALLFEFFSAVVEECEVWNCCVDRF